MFFNLPAKSVNLRYIDSMKNHLPLKWTFSEVFLTEFANCVHANFQYQSFQFFFNNQLMLNIRLLLLLFLFLQGKCFG